MTSKYLAIDPGETSGWATFDAQGNGLEMGQIKQLDLLDELKRLIHADLEEVIVEDYVNFAWKTQEKWSKNQTSKNIGIIEALCNVVGVKVHLVPASNKVIGYKWAGLDKAPSNHAISHQYDAYVHGVYRLQQQGIRPVGKAVK